MPGESFTAAVALKENDNLFAPSVTIPVQLTTGKGKLSGGSATTANGIASYSALQISEAGTGNVLTASLTLNDSASPAITLAAQSNSFDIAKLVATIQINNLNQNYTGLPLSVGFVTNPHGLKTSVTYNGSTAPPTNAGSYTVVATIDDSYYKGSASATLVIGKAASEVALETSATTALLRNPVILTAKVSSSTGAPTGSVTFFSGGVALSNPITLNANGVATLTTSSLPIGTDSLAAIYSGNANYNSIASNTVTESIVDFNFSTPSGSTTKSTIIPGQTSKFQFTLSTSDPSIPLPSDVALTVTGLPAGSTYTITPQMVSAGSGPTSATLTIATTATTDSKAKANHEGQLVRHAAPLALALMFLPWAHYWRKRGKKLARLLGILALTAAGGLSTIGINGCCEGGVFGQPQKNYTIVVTGTSGSLTHTINFTLTIE